MILSAGRTRRATTSSARTPASRTCVESIPTVRPEGTVSGLNNATHYLSYQEHTYMNRLLHRPIFLAHFQPLGAPALRAMWAIHWWLAESPGRDRSPGSPDSPGSGGPSGSTSSPETFSFCICKVSVIVKHGRNLLVLNKCRTSGSSLFSGQLQTGTDFWQ